MATFWSGLVKECRHRKACAQSINQHLFAEPADVAATGFSVAVYSGADRLSMSDSMLLS
jgi:hypothetical protein